MKWLNEALDRLGELHLLTSRRQDGLTDIACCNAPPQMDHLEAAQWAAGLLEREANHQGALVGGSETLAEAYRSAARCLRHYYVPAANLTGTAAGG